MGVPSLFNHLTNKYPTILVKNVRTDILCLDFNAIIHNSNRAKNPNEEKTFTTIKNYIEILFFKCKPKILYISIDGVAPRAKLNQQRARRYCAATEALTKGKRFFIEKKDENLKKAVEDVIQVIKEDDLEIVNERSTIKELKENKKVKNPYEDSNSSFDEEDLKLSSEDEEIWDSNCITPGTPFMNKLDKFIIDFIYDKLNNNSDWKKIRVIYSSFKVPGEGEQKIMDFLRSIENKKLNKTRQCNINDNIYKDVTIYSPDADLFFLTLSLHNFNVTILREEHTRDKCSLCNNRGHKTEACGNVQLAQFVYVSINELKRNILKDITNRMNRQINYNTNRIINDFIFICFFCGNDFLPTLPCFDVRFEAIDILCDLLIKFYNKTAKYLTNENYEIYFDRLKMFLNDLSLIEDNLYSRKLVGLRNTRRKFNMPWREEILLHTKAGKIEYYKKKLFAHLNKNENNTEFDDDVKIDFDDNKEMNNHQNHFNNKLDLFDHYEYENEREIVSREYLTGLAWTFSLYLKGLKSWSWYYPYHYAPFAADLAKIEDFKPQFSLGKNLSLLEQAIIVLPPMSKEHLPKQLHHIYEFKQFFPEHVEIDMFDKLLPWQGVVLLPFINIDEILREYYKVKLTLEDCYTNLEGNDLIFFVTNSDEFKYNLDIGEANLYCYAKDLGKQNAVFCGVFKLK